MENSTSILTVFKVGGRENFFYCSKCHFMILNRFEICLNLFDYMFICIQLPLCDEACMFAYKVVFIQHYI
jgi:hypothetical protein